VSTPTNLTSGRLLARNTILNLVGEAAPSLVAFVSVPLMIRGLGVDRYGVMTLIMFAVAYFSLFDFGLGRAATRLIADAIAAGDDAKVSGFFWTSLYLMIAFGTVAAIIISALAPWLVTSVLRIPPALRRESVAGFYLLALSTPFMLSGSSTNAILSAYQRFDLMNALRLPTSVLSYLAPLAVLPFSNHLGAVIAMMTAVRIAGWLVGMAICLLVVPQVRRDLRPRRATIRPMMSFGGWTTLSGLVHPIMAWAERFVIAAMISTAAVAYYAVPAQLAGKLMIIPSALSGVIFAALSATASNDPSRAASLFEHANRYILLIMFPLVLVLVTMAPEILALWVGPTFAAQGTTALRWLALAALFNAPAWMPFTMLQASNRPDVPTLLHYVELPVYLLTLWLGLKTSGIAGGAFANAFRCAFDSILLYTMLSRLVPTTALAIARFARIGAAAVIVIAMGALPMELPVKLLFLTFTLAIFAIAAWTILLDIEERSLLRSQMRTVLLPAFGHGH